MLAADSIAAGARVSSSPSEMLEGACNGLSGQHTTRARSEEQAGGKPTLPRMAPNVIKTDAAAKSALICDTARRPSPGYISLNHARGVPEYSLRLAARRLRVMVS